MTASVGGQSGPEVLIVDDNEDAAMSLMMLLELEDITAATASDAPAALRIVSAIGFSPFQFVFVRRAIPFSFSPFVHSSSQPSTVSCHTSPF